LTEVRFGLSSLDVAALPIYADATGAFARTESPRGSNAIWAIRAK